jgi:hypothetical protein
MSSIPRTPRRTVEEDVQAALSQLRNGGASPDAGGGLGNGGGGRAQRAVLRSDDAEQARFQEICRDRKPDGSCDVRNRSGGGAAAERRAEEVLTWLDGRMDRLQDDRMYGDVSGREVKQAWRRARWTIDPVGEDYGNDGVGGVRFDRTGPDISMELGALRRRQRFGTPHEVYQFLHDVVGHGTILGQSDSDYYGLRHDADPSTRDTPYDSNSRHFREEERKATQRAEAVAGALGVPFDYYRQRGY